MKEEVGNTQHPQPMPTVCNDVKGRKWDLAAWKASSHSLALSRVPLISKRKTKMVSENEDIPWKVS